ncbi:RnfABCDGE type electron transport complex subunit D [Vibrio coralliirubri]|uniref:RnfABCDGE type electron transport complex subunit D n=1 Tax=Vibrio coralliirubri TaxID=1516159 RepID=UPI0022833C5E|nr:RnfABCDGE type electron transport complex subunit D [Vibrio coralliirubri]MCY9864940.1 RnfABCDGE type electron transport complex subunit D [Vibrio coralliirubri]
MIENFVRKVGAKWATVWLLTPMAVFGSAYFGFQAAIVLATSVSLCVFAGCLSAYLDGKKMYLNPTSIITGLLIGMTVSPQTPIYMLVVGAFTAELLIKATCARGWLNPAVVGRAAIAILETYDPITYADLSTGASPLFKNESGASEPIYLDALLGLTKGSIGETSAILLLITGFLLLRYVVIKREAALTMLMAVPVVALIVPDAPDMIGHSPWTSDPILYIIAGPTLLMAFFFLTDPATLPKTKLGCVFVGLFVAVFAVVGRMHTSIAGVEMYGILVMNAATPLINKLTIRNKQVV